ncbi:hypothetical protein ABT104_30245, partial [Streptomyces mobaraensis]
LVVSPDGTEPGLALLLEQAYRRGCSVVCVTPAGSRRPPHADRTPRTPPLPATGRGRAVG